ncbi:MAG: tetratricopeptide repeat protein [Saprospiraceae bacterium]
MNIKSSINIFILISFSLIVFSCKTTKKKEEVSKFGKFYQNTTSYYNGYFNANEIYQLSIQKLNASHKDDYQKILPIYPYEEIENASIVNQDMDVVVEKLSRDINLHRAADWVDDCYLLIGKAQYVKQDFEKAEQTFEYFHDEMNPTFKKAHTTKKTKSTSKSKKSKKKSSKKKSSSKKSSKKKVLKRDLIKEEQKLESKKESKKDTKTIEKPKEPVVNTHAIGTKKDWSTYNEGLLWLAKTYIERDKMSGAFYLLNRLNTEFLDKDMAKEVNLVKAQYYLKQKKYADAVTPLNTAIANTSSKKERARYSYILGQIYEKLNRKADAYKMFNDVADMKPDYELEFNAILKLLKNYSGGNSGDYVQDELNKLLKEEKYFEYQDMIYFTMAESDFDNNQIDKAVENYNTSLKKNINNKALKTECYYKLANINFDKQNFILAKNYFDSTLMNIQQKDERYLDVKRLSENLKEIALNLGIIELQDSLVRISKMSAEEQKELATNIKKQKIEEENRIKENSNKNTDNTNPRDMAMMTPDSKGSSIKSSFFAYNSIAKETGKQEFNKTWGSIKLEDDWRRSNKISNSYEEIAPTENVEFEISDAEVNKILANVPKSPGEVSEAEAKIQNAMMNLGVLYRDKLQNYEKSAEILENLLSRFPKYEDACKANYYLQLSYKNLGKNNDANNIVSNMANNYPDCIYTKILTIPDFAKNINSIEDQKATYYENIVNAYANHDYATVNAKLKNAPLELTSDPKYSIKLDLLKAKMQGQISGKDDYILALESFIEKYPNSDEAVNVRETLRFLKGDQNAFSPLIYKEELDDFSYEPDKMHYVIVIVRNTGVEEVNEIKNKISNFNNKYFKLDRLKLSNIYFDTKGTDQIILIRKFDNAEQSLKYYETVESNENDFIDRKFSYEIYSVSQKNYRELIKQKSVDNYKQYFDKTYLKK